MKSNWKWTSLKHLIAATSCDQAGPFLSVIGEDGTILCANAGMKKSLHLDGCTGQVPNLLDHVHPESKDELRKIMHESDTTAISPVELHIRNDHYHPMKWHISSLPGDGQRREYLCIGYKILDDKRQAIYSALIRSHYHFILEGLGGVIFQNRHGEIIAVNRKTATVFNTTMENLYLLKNISPLWNNVWDIRDEQGQKIFFDDTPFIRAFTREGTHQQTMQIKLKTGERKWIHFTSQLLPADAATDEPVVVSSLVDVTRERQLLIALQEKEALINALLKETPNPSWVVDAENRLLFASDAFYKLFRLRENVLGKKVTELLAPAVLEKVVERHAQVRATGLPVHVAEPVTWANGVKYISHINIFPLPAIGEGVVGGQATFLPDTSKLENELQAAQQRLLLISKATTDAIWEWDMQSGQIFRNETLMAMIGYQQDNSRGLSWWLRRIHPHDRDRVADKVKEATEHNQQYWQEEYRFKCADGSYIHIRDKGYVVYENGLPVKMIGSLQDISGFKELENKLIDERLQVQKKNAEMVMKVQEKERSRISKELHDNVNQLLSTSRLFIDAIQTGTDEQRQVKMKSIEYLQMAVEEIRQLSKELSSPHLQHNSLGEILRTMINDINMVGSLSITLFYDEKAEELSVGKKTTLFRVLQEQMKNILKHSGASQATVSLTMEKEEVVLVIEDNGKGFEPGQTHRGIGLANIQERTNYYNGRVSIRSRTGSGCTVSVWLPSHD